MPDTVLGTLLCHDVGLFYAQAGLDGSVEV